MRYSPDFIEKVRDANNIVDVFAEYTQLKRNGSRLMGLCPFPGHNEKTPSFSVSEDKQVYHCFGCQRSGNIYKALEELKGFSFRECVEYLAHKASISLPRDANADDSHEQKAKVHREQLIKINTLAAKFYNEQLARTAATHFARVYAQKRRLTSEIIEQFQIGYSPESWDALALYLKRAGAPLELAAELGLIRKRKEGDGYYDFFRNRLMFAIHSHKGECVGFGARALVAGDDPKYRNSSESALFIKGQTFYGLNETAKYIRTEGFAVVVEGYMDFLALYAAGVRNVVATLGTAMTAQHAHLLKRYTSNVVVLFDGDSAGQNAALRSLPILLGEELLARAIALPDELDPDEFIEERGSDELKKLLRTAPDLFSVILDRKLHDFRGSSSDKINLLNEVGPLLKSTKDTRLQELYISEVAQKIGVETQFILKHLAGAAEVSQVVGVKRANVAENRPLQPAGDTKMLVDVIDFGPKISLSGAQQSELFLLNIALMSPDRFNSIWSTQIVPEISHSGVRQAFEKAESIYRQMPNEFAKLSAYLMTIAEPTSALALHMGQPLAAMGADELTRFASDCVRQVREKFLRSKTRELAASLQTSLHTTTKTEDGLSDEQVKKLEQIMNIQKSKRTLRRDREIE